MGSANHQQGDHVTRTTLLVGSEKCIHTFSEPALFIPVVPCPFSCPHRIAIICCFSHSLLKFGILTLPKGNVWFPPPKTAVCPVLTFPPEQFSLQDAESLKGATDILWVAASNWENRNLSQDLKSYFQEWANSGGSGKWARSSCRVKGTKSISKFEEVPIS